MSERNPTTPPPLKAQTSLPLELADDDIQQVAQVELQETPRDDAALAETETIALEVDRLKLEIQEIRQGQVEATELHDIRKKYVGRLFWLIVCWLGFVVIFVALTGFHLQFSLSDEVLIAFITSTTISVLGLFAVVAKWLYPTPLVAGKPKK